MPKRTIKLIGILLAFLIIFNFQILSGLQPVPDFYVLSSCILLLFLVFVLFFIEIKRMENTNSAMVCVLEKSEENRINAESLKNKVLLMADDLPEGIIVIDKNHKVSYINNKAEKFLGIHRKQILSKPILELERLSDARKIVVPLLINFKSIHKEQIQLRKNLILDLIIEPLVFGKNNIGKLIILHDATKIINAESAKNQFVSVIAHQLKSPLSVTKLSVKMLIGGDFGKINKEQKNILEKIYKNNESLIYMIEDLLKEVRNNEKGQLEKRSLVDLGELAVSVADFYDSQMKEKKIDFKFKKSWLSETEKLPKISVDPEKIKIVIQNLFDNAVKYTPSGGKIEIGIAIEKDNIRFEIKDNGIGISEDQKKKIFTRFSRADNATKTKIAGSGLGLSIAKDIIESYNGKIWFQSKAKETGQKGASGSTFYFCLPYAGE